MTARTLKGIAAEVKKANKADIRVNDQDIAQEIAGQEFHRLLVDWNYTASAFPSTTCIHELFGVKASQTPTAVAVVFGDRSLTYAELDSYSNQIAHHLRSLGVGPEVIVAMCMERSPEMIAGILGILKASGAYLPLDRSYPGEHIGYLLKDANVRLVLVSDTTEGLFAPICVNPVKIAFQAKHIIHQPKTAPVNLGTAENLAYVIYTSGSSGRPKGVSVTHRNISRLVLNTNYVKISTDDVLLQLAPVTFDAATFEIWGALLNGAKLILCPSEPILDIQKLRGLMLKTSVTTLWLTAGLFNSIVDADVLADVPLKQLLVGGDTVSAPHVKRLMKRLPNCTVINGYGPTEGTTFSVCFPITDLAAIGNSVPIGRPISNTTVYVLDDHGKVAQIGEAGELFIGGAGISRGYSGRPDLTAEVFAPNPFGEPGSRLYRTGDLVRYMPDGVIEFIGRMDFQVKVRGYRIEPEEIEAALLLDPGIRQAVVVALPDSRSDKRLVAYVVSAKSVELDWKKIREQLGHRLPEYMIPSLMVSVDALPLTANGKIDRKALPSPESVSSSALLQPGLEQAVAEIWKSALSVSQVGAEDDFFDLGGTSLALINVVVEMSKRFALPLDTSIVARGATVRALASAVREQMAADPVPSSALACVAA
jgi:amino acid adenylation domain-containing protein